MNNESSNNNNEIDQIFQRKQNLLNTGLQALQHIKISEIVCNHFAAHFLSEDGTLYTMGNDQKKYGILGLGTLYDQNEPQPNQNLKDIKISKISMGLSHCCVLTTNGQLYSWGTGLNGQLCHSDDTMFSNVPKMVQTSKNMNIQQIHCSNYYTLIINTKGKLSMFGTLKGFAKFLFESPSKDIEKQSQNNMNHHQHNHTHDASMTSTTDQNHNSSHNNSQDQSTSLISDRVVRKFKLNLGKNEKITKVCTAERSFMVYCQESQNTYYVNENFEHQLILSGRELKSFQFINAQKYIVAHDTNNMLILMSQQDDDYQAQFSPDGKWQIVKEFNLSQYFGAQDLDMVPIESNIHSKKTKILQQLSFVVNPQTQQKFQTANFNKSYYKSFLNQPNPASSQQFQTNTLTYYNNLATTQLQGPNQNNGLNNNAYDKENSIMSDSKYTSSAYESKTRNNKLKFKIDSIFGTTFSARKGRSNSTSIKERAKKLHQSLSPIQRFPIINNLCEFIKQQQRFGGAGVAAQNGINLNNINNNLNFNGNNTNSGTQSPPKFGQNLFLQSQNETPFNFNNMNKQYQDQIKSPQYNLFLKSLNLACQLTSLGNVSNENGLSQSQKQQQFLSKADKIRQELNKKQAFQQQHHCQSTVNYDSVNRNNQTAGTVNIHGQGDMMELASPETSRNEQLINFNMPLQVAQQNLQQKNHIQHIQKSQDMPLQTSSMQNSHNNIKLTSNLSCILEDRENNNSTMIQNQVSFDNHLNQEQDQSKKLNGRQPSLKIPDYPHKLMSSQRKDQRQDMNQMLNIDCTISEISGIHMGRDSMNRFSQYGASDMTNTNNYKILVMNARNVIEKKILQHLMVGFMAIKYHQSHSLQSFRLQTTINHHSQQSLQFMEDNRLEQGLDHLQNFIYQNQKQSMFQAIRRIQEYSHMQKEKQRVFKKLALIIKQKEEQIIIDAMRKIQLSIRFKKLQRLNINLLFNCFGKLLKRQNKQDVLFSFNQIKQHSHHQHQANALTQINNLINKKLKKQGLTKFEQNKDRVNNISKAFKLLKKAHSQILFRKHLNQKSQALYLFKKNVINFQISRTDKIHKIITKIYSKKYFKQWHHILMKRKAAIQQAIFLKMFISDKIKQTQYYAILKLINFSNRESQSQTKKSNQSKSTNKQEQNSLQIVTQELISNMNEVTRKLEFAEKSIQNDTNHQELDIQDTQLDEADYYQIQKLSKQSSCKHNNLPFKKTSGKEFSFEKHELAYANDYFQGQENDMTAHFNKFNLMSKAKDSSNQLHLMNSNSAFKEQRSHYHCHYANEEKVALEAFTLDPSFNTRNSVSVAGVGGHSREPSGNIRLSIPLPLEFSQNNINHTENKRDMQLQYSQASKMRMSIQDEISPTNNIKNYQRQAQLNKNYEQSDPFELPPANDDTDLDFPQCQLDFNQEYNQFIDKNIEHSNIADDGLAKDIGLNYETNQHQQSQQIPQQQYQYEPRYSFNNVVPFNPPDDTPSENYLRQKGNIGNGSLQFSQNTQPSQSINYSQNQQHKVFDSKKGSNASSLVNSQANSQKSSFINNYFAKLSAQNSVKNENKNKMNQQHPQQQLQQSTPTLFQGSQHTSNSKNKENFNQLASYPQNNSQQQYMNQAHSHHSSQQQYQQHQSSHPLTQASFVTANNNIDLMHFNSHSDNTSFLFFDDNFWRESGISSASRITNLGKLGPLVNQSFGQSLQNQNLSQLQHHQQQFLNQMIRQNNNITNINNNNYSNSSNGHMSGGGLSQSQQIIMKGNRQQQQQVMNKGFNSTTNNVYNSMGQEGLQNSGRFNQTNK